MPDIGPITAARAAMSHLFQAVHSQVCHLASAHECRCDVILTFAPSVFSALFNALILRAAFAILILGLIASLARMWFLTFRDRP